MVDDYEEVEKRRDRAQETWNSADMDRQGFLKTVVEKLQLKELAGGVSIEIAVTMAFDELPFKGRLYQDDGFYKLLLSHPKKEKAKEKK